MALMLNSRMSTRRYSAEALCQPPNKQLQGTVTRRRGRGACAALHFAHAPRWTFRHAAAEPRR
jgi:hypothetical protein